MNKKTEAVRDNAAALPDGTVLTGDCFPGLPRFLAAARPRREPARPHPVKGGGTRVSLRARFPGQPLGACQRTSVVPTRQRGPDSPVPSGVGGL